ncbi:type I glyceraldehyde-3-phosphate dehydrogenase [Mesoterricola silvestris]|uniref:Glyceraldehyde-3-phosphate dehydrogenase n=1 Tax=Mesoterricola silvestris TaxID=2927979 RepID=A0AA48GJL3_9BACT|nr:type I glyceraldehyde-3-phosphate dehydrogenase [Mesoterricola silvestris]BDU72507.1 glyceraldehyde-3-phosphate dehydrogenase [Mesoterricola silvestris]
MIAINGLGRIGRLAARRLALQRPHRLCALNDPADLETVVHLLRFDSIHGDDHPAVLGLRKGDWDFIVMEGKEYPLYHETDPARIPFGDHQARVVVEASGRFATREGAARHLRGPVRNVVISAPSPDADFTVIHPFNGHLLDPERHRVISNASCTAHATAPILDVLDKAFGLETASMSTVHVATNDQRLLDLPHKDLRRARAAFMSIIPTTSSAFGALRKALPHLPGGFDGWALRVPCLNVNLVDLTAVLRRPVTPAELNDAFDEASRVRLRGILAVSEGGLVSRDFTGREESVVMDPDLTRVVGGTLVKVCGWHDNELAYAARLCELVNRL